MLRQETRMEYRDWSGTGERVSAFVLGAWQFGKSGWSDVEDQESIEVMHQAIDAGINVIDTAFAYGDGYSEEVVGRAVRDRRDEVMIASKCDGNPGLIRNVDQALQRLQTDFIDLYQIHYPLPQYPVAQAIEAMEEIRQAGKIRYIGVSNFNLRQLQEAVSTARIHSCQPPYNVFWRQFEDDVIPFCAENNIAVLPYSTLAQGLLTGKFRSRSDIPHDIRSNNKLFAEGIFEQCVEVVELVEEIGRRYDRSPAQTALAWTIQAPGITSPIVGARTTRQLESNLAAIGFRLTDDEWSRISEAGRKISDQLDYSTNMWGWAPS